jgi:hypothetical protein
MNHFYYFWEYRKTMSKRYGLLLAGILFTSVIRLSAQDFEVPKNLSLKYTVDYATYEPDVIKCVDWLENSPLDKDKDKHAAAYGFLLLWITGAPNVHVLVDADLIGAKGKKNVGLTAIYMGEWSRYELKHGDKTTQTDAAVAAVRAEIKVYKKGNGLVKDKTMDKLVELDEKGQLVAYVGDKMAKTEKASKTKAPAGH